ncbi:MAG: ISL3 family transposase, partial [Coriobacteriaceae bacterium]|nr:ISL3 family transposase [Coriobacteriaceae bacterium]
MDPRAEMLAGLFERSMGLGPERRVEDVWFEEGSGGSPDEPHVRVGRVPGMAVECPACGARRGVYDTRERTWRHLDIWQYETVVHCAVPRVDCPEDGVLTALMPWEARPSSHFAALFEAQVLVMALSGMTAAQVAGQLRLSDSRVWAILGGAVGEALGRADYSGVRRVGVDDTARRRGQNCVSTMAGLDGRRALAVTEGGDKGAAGRLCEELEPRGGDRSAVAEATRDMSRAYALGVAEQMPQAAQTVDRFHAMQLFEQAVGRVRCAEAKSSAEKRRLPKGTKYVWLKRPENLTERQAARKGSLMGEHLLTARACAMAEAMRAVLMCVKISDTRPPGKPRRRTPSPPSPRTPPSAPRGACGPPPSGATACC